MSTGRASQATRRREYEVSDDRQLGFTWGYPKSARNSHVTKYIFTYDENILHQSLEGDDVLSFQAVYQNPYYLTMNDCCSTLSAEKRALVNAAVAWLWCFFLWTSMSTTNRQATPPWLIGCYGLGPLTFACVCVVARVINQGQPFSFSSVGTVGSVSAIFANGNYTSCSASSWSTKIHQASEYNDGQYVVTQ